MSEKEYKITLTEEDKNKLEQVLKLVDIVVDMVEVEDTKESEEKEWLKDGDIYYYIHSNGEIANSNFYLNDSFCKNILSVGNYFRTKEEAEFEVERLKVIAEMKKFAESEDREWDGYTKHYCFYYDCNTDSMQCICKMEYKYGGIYFETQEKARECVEAIGEDRIRKLYLQIKE